jgi:LmbE family N-acetylglucosaminyl deacetylase
LHSAFKKVKKIVALVVAHPDDETLWAGGTILSHPEWQCFILSLCRKSDPDRAPRFYEALKVLKSRGAMGDLDDGPEQKPLEDHVIENVILDLLPATHFDLIISHNPSGEYTRHIRHEEVGRAVMKLWQEGIINADELWTFAYEDGHKQYYPRAVENTAIYLVLTTPVWLSKYSIITETYGFLNTSWEAKTTPRIESFRKFTNPNEAHESIGII